MAVTNPEAIRFCNEVIRPLAERFRSLKADVDAAQVKWAAGMSAQFPNDPLEPVEDGRESEGVSRLTAQDVAFFNGVMGTFKTNLDTPGIPQIVAKPCVRSLVTNG